MIAANYIKYPEALRFQREMFSNGYHNSPRIMRLMECMFTWTASIPQWVKDAKRRAVALVKVWKNTQIDINFFNRAFAAVNCKAKYLGPNGETWSGRGLMPKWLSALVKQGYEKEAFDLMPNEKYFLASTYSQGAPYLP